MRAAFDPNRHVLSVTKGWAFEQLYTCYRWQGDSHENGFRNMTRLEQRLRLRSRMTGKDILAVAAWGRLPGRRARLVSGPVDIGALDAKAAGNAASLIRDVKQKIRGFGLAFTSKLLRFYDPVRFGVLDSVLARSWPALGLQVCSGARGSYVPATMEAFKSYATWVTTLACIASRLNAAHRTCPHPPVLLAKRLREKGRWTCADVEMALFAKAKRIRRCRLSRQAGHQPRPRS